MVQITEAELKRLRVMARRFEWFVRIWAAAFGERQADLLQRIDEGIDGGGMSPDGIASMLGASIRGRKKPVSGLNRPRASNKNPGNAPGRRTDLPA